MTAEKLNKLDQQRAGAALPLGLLPFTPHLQLPGALAQGAGAARAPEHRNPEPAVVPAVVPEGILTAAKDRERAAVQCQRMRTCPAGQAPPSEGSSGVTQSKLPPRRVSRALDSPLKMYSEKTSVTEKKKKQRKKG